MKNTTLQLEKLTFPLCIQKITKAVDTLTGVQKTTILFESSKARIYQDADLISEDGNINETREIGYEAEVI